MSEINRLKRRAKKLRIDMQYGYERGDCGAALMEFISPNLAAQRVEFEAIWARLRELDPNCPPPLK